MTWVYDMTWVYKHDLSLWTWLEFIIWFEFTVTWFELMIWLEFIVTQFKFTITQFELTAWLEFMTQLMFTNDMTWVYSDLIWAYNVTWIFNMTGAYDNMTWVYKKQWRSQVKFSAKALGLHVAEVNTLLNSS